MAEKTLKEQIEAHDVKIQKEWGRRNDIRRAIERGIIPSPKTTGILWWRRYYCSKCGRRLDKGGEMGYMFIIQRRWACPQDNYEYVKEEVCY